MAAYGSVGRVITAGSVGRTTSDCTGSRASTFVDIFTGLGRGR